MKKALRGIWSAALVTLLAGAGAQACSVATVAGADSLIRPEKINQKLIDATIRAEVNYHRCKRGLRQLSGSNGLAKVAATHAKWMARTRSVSHKSGVAGQGTLKARMSTSGVRFKAAAENIGMVHRFALEGAPFKIAGNCQFATYGGQPIGAHSYASLARQAVTLWVNSKGHRENILNRRVKLTGAGAGFAANAPYCGQFFLAQDFAG